MHVVLVHPEIAPNTGNIIRLCANTGAHLHLVEPLGFTLEDKLLRRAGLDYHELTTMTVHPSFEAVDLALGISKRAYAFSSRGTRRFTEVAFSTDDVLVFGAENAGLTESHLAAFPPERLLTIPMRADNRSMNLSNAVAVVVYEAWRQSGFEGAAPTSTPLPGHGLTAELPKQTPFDR
jgi:tRNA (cytidine/uridine-2'-O-)-methyltransferase